MMRHLFLVLAFCLALISCHQKEQKDEGPTVSVICPTYNRPDKHPLLYLAFSHQHYPNKELLVHDDSARPSPFFLNLKDERVTYIHNPIRKSIGTKRNDLIALAKGEIIAHFDDDDYYAPTYLETMVRNLGDADLVKFSKWLAYRESDHTFWEWDTTNIGHSHFIISGWGDPDQVRDFTELVPDPKSYNEANTWGYGFSFVFRKSLWEECHFPDTSAGEDGLFARAAIVRGRKVVHMSDDDHLVLHIIHSVNMSKILPQKKYSGENWKELVGNEATPWLHFP